MANLFIVELGMDGDFEAAYIGGYYDNDIVYDEARASLMTESDAKDIAKDVDESGQFAGLIVETVQARRAS